MRTNFLHPIKLKSSSAYHVVEVAVDVVILYPVDEVLSGHAQRRLDKHTGSNGTNKVLSLTLVCFWSDSLVYALKILHLTLFNDTSVIFSVLQPGNRVF